MKKIYLLSVVILIGIGSAGCSTSTSNSSEDAKTENTRISDQASANNSKIAKSLEKQFNTDGQKIVVAKVETEVIDEHLENDKAHQDITVLVKDKDTVDKLKADKAAIDNGTANDDQKMYIAGIQEIIHNEAQKIQKNTGAVSFGYEEDAQNTVLIASSNKSDDLIKPVEIDI